MTVCKYFMSGYCKYGSRCRFEHVNPYDGYDSRRHTDYSSIERQSDVPVSILRSGSAPFGGQQTFGQSFNQTTQENKQQFSQGFSQSQDTRHQFSQNFSQVPQENKNQFGHQFNQGPQQSRSTATNSKFNIHDIMQVVARDIVQAEKGNQWLLSSYSPGKDLANIPGLEDHSPEELRWECYKALQNSSLPLWQAIVQQLQANVIKINNDLKKKDTGYTIIESWLREEAYKQSNMPPSYDTSGVPFYPQPTTNASFSFSLPQHQPTAELMPTSGNVFSQTSHSTPNQQFSSQPQYYIEDSHAYTSIQNLLPNELEAFKANRFVIGSIPTKPPPKELCNV